MNIRSAVGGKTPVGKTALITGVTGQDGAYLSKLLLTKGYRVVGAMRRGTSPKLARLKFLDVDKDVEFIDLELSEVTGLIRTIERVRPDELYNLAAQSFVSLSIEEPVYTLEVNALGFARLLEAVRTVKSDIRIYQASSSEMFGEPNESPQTETTKLSPRSPYAIGKAAAHWLAVNYRQVHGLYAVSGILFNHESPLRGRQFVTRRITLGLAEVKRGKRDVLTLGNLNAKRDWGSAEEYVAGMQTMLQQGMPDDYVLATGQMTSVRQFAQIAASLLGLRLEWHGVGVDEVGVDLASGRTIVKIDSQHFRELDINSNVGSAQKANETFGWQCKVDVNQLAASMAAADDKRVCDNDHDI
jgi:GDPmannose 4,6-dehydratase